MIFSANMYATFNWKIFLLDLKNVNLMEIPVMAHDQNDNSGSSLTDLPNVGEHGCFVSRQIVRFMQYSWNGAFLGLKEWFSKGLSLYNFSALRQAQFHSSRGLILLFFCLRVKIYSSKNRQRLDNYLVPSTFVIDNYVNVMYSYLATAQWGFSWSNKQQ